MQATAKPQKTAKSTASQILAAQRKQKQQVKIKREANSKIGTHYGKHDRNRLSAYKENCNRNIERLKQGETKPYEERLDSTLTMLLHHDTLIYSSSNDHKTVRYAVMCFEKYTNNVRVVAAMYRDRVLNDTANNAQNAIEKLSNNLNTSPNENRKNLAPVMRMIQMMEQYDETIPAHTVDAIGLYCAAVQIASATTELYMRPSGHVQAMLDIINGKSLRETAKLLGMNQNQTKKSRTGCRLVLLPHMRNPQPQHRSSRQHPRVTQRILQRMRRHRRPGRLRQKRHEPLPYPL